MPARKAFARYLRERARPDSDFEGAELIYAELVGNVVRHAPGPIRIDLLWADDGRAALRVADGGAGFNPVSAISRDRLNETGRGLIIVASLAIRIRVDRHSEGSAVTAVLRVLRVVADAEMST
ncbi:MAG: ATP-binding protein [Candidatus Eremiobacteraeota bacterium]|nr:ATP-binding protein [Candidatus Eremiobacteraeota bacterium]